MEAALPHQEIINADCMRWLDERPENSITAIVTDPPYGLKEYTSSQLEKKRNGHGGVWRLPQSFDGHQRNPVPRFSVINDSKKDREALYEFFNQWGKLAYKVLVPGGHIMLASTILLSDVVSAALRDAGLERRGEIMRSVSTLRGGDRPKGYESIYPDTCVLPRGTIEPWELFRKPLSERTIGENLAKWQAGALRRSQDGLPIADYIPSSKPGKEERSLSNHPSLKPQSFMRKIVWAALPLGKGIVLDPFSGSGSTIAAAKSIGYDAIGLERDEEYYAQSLVAMPKLAALETLP